MVLTEPIRTKDILLPEGDASSESHNVVKVVPPIELFADAAVATAPFTLPRIPFKVSQFFTFEPGAGDSPSVPMVMLQVYCTQAFGDFTALLEKASPAHSGSFPRDLSAAIATGSVRELMKGIREVFLADPSVAERIRRELRSSKAHASDAGKGRLLEALIRIYEGSNNRFLLILFGGSAWLVFVYFPKKTLSVAGELAEIVKNTLGLTPQVTINQKIIYKRTNEILQLAMIEQDFDVEYEASDKRLGSEKRINLRGMYRAKIGFDLQKGFNIEVHRGRFLGPGRVILQLPHAEVLSVEPLDVRKTASSGLINWVTNKDIENATRELTALAQDQASKLAKLADAEKRIENRLNRPAPGSPAGYGGRGSGRGMGRGQVMGRRCGR